MGDYITTTGSTASTRSVESVSDIIDGRVYISNLRAAENSALLTRLGITHVLSVCPPSSFTQPIPPVIPQEHRLSIPVQDSEHAEILGYLSAACEFIQRALDEREESKVLVHCVMGVSRSATVVAAYRMCLLSWCILGLVVLNSVYTHTVMKTRNITHTDAISYIRSRTSLSPSSSFLTSYATTGRAIIHPNYGFRLQLAVFSACAYTPTSTHPAYTAWKRKSKRVLRKYVGVVQDTVEVVKGEVFVCSELPTDPEQAECLLYDHGITHVLALSDVEQVRCGVDVRKADLDSVMSMASCSSSRTSSVVIEGLDRLRDACAYVDDAVRKGGEVLVYGESEMVACVVVCTYRTFPIPPPLVPTAFRLNRIETNPATRYSSPPPAHHHPVEPILPAVRLLNPILVLR
jgi:dual specificity phosphatase 12